MKTQEDERLEQFLQEAWLWLKQIVIAHIDFPLVFMGIWLAIGIAFNFNSLGLITSVFIGFLYIGVVIYLMPRLKKHHYRRKARRRLLKVMGATLYKPEDGLNASRALKVRNGKFVGTVRAEISTPLGRSDDDVMSMLKSVESALRLERSITIDDDPRKGVVSVLLCFVSPLDNDLDSSTAPILHLTPEEVSDPYHWLPVGIDEEGKPFEFPLFLKEGGSVRNLTSGMSGAGKGSIVKQQLLQATLNPKIDVVIVDGKGSEFHEFESHANKYASDKVGFFEVLRYLEDEVRRRSLKLKLNKLQGKKRTSSSWNSEDDGNFLVWVWDELGIILAGLSSKEQLEVQQRLYGVLSVARSLGIAAILSSQTFRSDLLDTKIRDNCFDLLVGFRVQTLQESTYIGFSNLDRIRPDLIGGKLLKEGKSSTAGQFASKGIRNSYGKSYNLTDEQIRTALASKSDT